MASLIIMKHAHNARDMTNQTSHRTELGQRRGVGDRLGYEHACDGDTSEEVARKPVVPCRSIIRCT